ncbi:hypothetical protein E3N88_14465 [Mikania micrantha]|uniref:Uncharacterized protein n=1 Tax=Mikania micrantha TaxID=192012 RepID=A0A5N6P4K2_9ASTR|nr:hypothetical protein E3N88_14465 [Mikania micrantha]
MHLLEFSNSSPSREDGGDSGAKLQQWLPSSLNLNPSFTMVSMEVLGVFQRCCRCSGTDKLEGWRLGAIKMMRVGEMMDFGSLKRCLATEEPQAYRLAWANHIVRYARIRSDEALKFHPRASPVAGFPGQAYRLAWISSPISLFLLFWPNLARFSIIERRSSVVWTLSVKC